MKKNIFEMGAKISDGWSLDTKITQTSSKILSQKEHQLVFRFEKRNGRAVTIVGRFYIKEEEKKELLSYLKKSLGVGGTLNEEWIELQGDIKQKVIDTLVPRNWKFR